MQNSQRVHDAKPRTEPMARRRDGDIAPYRQATRGRVRGEGNGGDIDRGHPRTPRVERREPGGWGAPRAVAARWGHRALPPSRTRDGARQRYTGVRGVGAWAWGTGGARAGTGVGFSEYRVLDNPRFRRPVSKGRGQPVYGVLRLRFCAHGSRRLL